MRAVTNDDVIEDGDAEEFSGADESTRELDVVAARRRVATRVIVRLMCPESLCAGGSAIALLSDARQSHQGT